MVITVLILLCIFYVLMTIGIFVHPVLAEFGIFILLYSATVASLLMFCVGYVGA